MFTPAKHTQGHTVSEDTTKPFCFRTSESGSGELFVSAYRDLSKEKRVYALYHATYKVYTAV